MNEQIMDETDQIYKSLCRGCRSTQGLTCQVIRQRLMSNWLGY